MVPFCQLYIFFLMQISNVLDSCTTSKNISYNPKHEILLPVPVFHLENKIIIEIPRCPQDSDHDWRYSASWAGLKREKPYINLDKTLLFIVSYLMSKQCVHMRNKCVDKNHRGTNSDTLCWLYWCDHSALISQDEGPMMPRVMKGLWSKHHSYKRTCKCRGCVGESLIFKCSQCKTPHSVCWNMCEIKHYTYLTERGYHPLSRLFIHVRTSAVSLSRSPSKTGNERSG